MNERPRPLEGIMDITPYKGGESKINHDHILKLSSNESPFGCAPSAKAAALAALAEPQLYPDGGHIRLRKAIAGAYGLDANRVVCGAGSDEIISFAIKGFCPPGSEVIHTKHAFAMYKIYAMGAGARPVSVEETEFAANVDHILEAVNNNTRAVFLANPNNPTGTWIPKDDIHRLADQLPTNILLVLDGAYGEYLEDHPDYDPGHQLAMERANVVVTGTCSKVHGLGGLRVGWGAASEEIISVMNRIRGPFNVSAVGLAAAEAAISDTVWWRNAVHKTNLLRETFVHFLNKQEIRHIPSAGNFVTLLLDDATSSQALDQHLRDHGIITRSVASYHIREGLRVSIGDEPAMERVCDAIKSWGAP